MGKNYQLQHGSWNIISFGRFDPSQTSPNIHPYPYCFSMWRLYMFPYIYHKQTTNKTIGIPRTQMTPVLNRKGLVFGGLTFKNRGQLGSRYKYISPIIILWVSIHCHHLQVRTWSRWIQSPCKDFVAKVAGGFLLVGDAIREPKQVMEETHETYHFQQV